MNSKSKMQRSGLKQVLPLLFFICVALLSSTKVGATDRATLATIYSQSGGANWTNKTNWLSGYALYTWYGVNGGPEDVYVLNLSSNNLSAFPTNVVNLSLLTELRLNGNGFTGSLPTGLTSLNNLAGLYLQNNQFTGSIPSAYNNLKCYGLDLSNNQLGGAIPALNTFMARTSGVNISNNNFVFADLANLKPYISKVTYSPQSQIGVETTLSLPLGSELTIPGYTPYTGDVFQWYRNGVAITGNKVGYISGTYYCKVTNPAFPALTLTSRNITVTGTKPANIYNISDTELDALWALYVSTNGDTWTNHSGWFVNTDVERWYGVDLLSGKVVQIIITRNNLTGSIPAELENLSNLEYLNLSSNPLTGSIPAELGNLSNLEVLYIYGNSLTGSIPAALGSLSKLEWLWLDNNSLTGSIPAELGNLSNLEYLNLCGNSLTGSIPAELGNLTNLKYLDLRYNSLSGSIPASLGNLSNLSTLYLINNSLTGIVPESVCNIPYTWIKGGNNSFSAPYPSCWSTLKSATVEEPIDPTEIMESCMREARNSNIDGEALSDYIHNCMAEKMGAKQVLAGAEKMETSTLKAYPNPAKTVLNIDAPFESYDVRLFDFSGRKVLEQQCCDNERLNVSMLKKGIYMLVVESEGKQHTQKITIE